MTRRERERELKYSPRNKIVLPEGEDLQASLATANIPPKWNCQIVARPGSRLASGKPSDMQMSNIQIGNLRARRCGVFYNGRRKWQLVLAEILRGRLKNVHVCWRSLGDVRSERGR